MLFKNFTYKENILIQNQNLIFKIQCSDKGGRAKNYGYQKHNSS